MPITYVSECLRQARECAALADMKSGDEKKRLQDLAHEWLKLADKAALQAEKNRSIKTEPSPTKL